jgi:hypothetical protein
MAMGHPQNGCWADERLKDDGQTSSPLGVCPVLTSEHALGAPLFEQAGHIFLDPENRFGT